MSDTSTPTIEEFEPIASQLKVIEDIKDNFDYSKGVHQILLSGTAGSAKSLLLAHIICLHCLENPGAVFGIGRLSLPSLKETLIQKIRDHLYGVVDHRYYETNGNFHFPNKSKIISFSWSDKNYKRFRSYELSGMAFEELTETKTSDAYDEAYMRVGRLAHVNERLIISATNPDSPAHWAYKKLIDKKDPLTMVYYSSLDDNPYLPQSYKDNMLNTLDPKMAQRMVYGKWIEINQEVVYYAYEKDKNFINSAYKVNPAHPIHICWDFNIGVGKPLSVALFQYISGVMHIFAEIIIEGQRTAESCDELYERGFLNYNTKYFINGDATGKRRDTRSILSDYEIIDKFFSNLVIPGRGRINYEMDVPQSNPPIRTRHNLMNGQICNANNQRNLFVYKDAKTVDEGLRLTKLKAGGLFQEDDSDYFQHVTTAVGYGLWAVKRKQVNHSPTALKR